MRYTHLNESTTPNTTDWENINWYSVEKSVDKIQKRIYEAELNGNSRQVRNLQRLLYRSHNTLLLAVRRVTEDNSGRRTAGIDGFKALNPKSKGELVDKLKTMDISKHRPKPVRRTYIPKKNGKLRSLGIPTIIDRVYQEIIRMALEPQAEVHFEPISYGFRPKRGAFDAIARIFNNMKRGNWCWIFEGDFRACFDNLSHEFILEQIKGFPLLKVVERFLKAGYIDNSVFNKTEKGTPQGGLLSPLLANIALTGLEKQLNITYKEIHYKKGQSYQTKGNYRVVRYADDFVIFARTKTDIEKVWDILQPYLEERGLELAEEKTRIVHANEGFDFLGFNCRLYKTFKGYKCFIKPSKDSVKKCKQKIADIFHEHNGSNVDNLIDHLNYLLRGNAFYWRTVVSKETYSKIDCYVWTKTKKFLKRLHPNKSWKWLRNKYFPIYTKDGRRDRWVLTGPKDGNTLFKMNWVPIRRWIMIKHNYSPYDKTKDEYFNNRECNRYLFG